MEMGCQSCDGEGGRDRESDFGAYVQAYRSTRDKPELRKKVIQKARQLFLIRTPRKETRE